MATIRNPLRSRSAAIALCALLLGFTSACAHLGSGGASRLEAEAKAAFDAKDLPTAYERLKQIEVRYPGSAESRNAFPKAAAVLRSLYFKNRSTDPNSIWVTSEPEFMFGWLATYFREGSPEAAANAFFVGFSVGTLRSFEVYAKGHPELAQWSIRAQDDNGIIESVTTERLATPAP
jgi:hypothetical protein